MCVSTRHLLVFLLAILPLPAIAQCIPPGTTVIQPGTTAVAQTVIPRYVSGTTFPAGQITGFGPQSILTGTSATASTGSTKAVVITDGYGTSISQWQTQSPGTQPAVLQPIIRDITIAGYSTNGWDSGGDVNDGPNIYNKTDTDKYAGLVAHATGGTLENVTLFYIPGTAAQITRPGSLLNGATRQFDRLKWNVHDLYIRRVFRGIWMNATDSHLTDVEVTGFRDYGVRIGEYQAGGAVQFARIHAYGGGMLAADNTSTIAGQGGMPAGVDSAAIWIDGDNNHGVDCYGENAPVGLYIKGSYNALDGLISHTCWVTNVNLGGSFNHISKARVDVLGDDWTINFDGGSGTFQAGESVTFGGGASGTVLTVTGTSSAGTLTVRQVAGAKPADNESITGPHATASVNGTPTVLATRTGVNFLDQYNSLVDSTVQPSGSSAAIVLSNGQNQTLRDVVVGSYNNFQSTGIKANYYLYNCRIDAHITGGGTGLDLVSGGSATITSGISLVTGGTNYLGSGNVIHITTSNSTVVRARLPAGWTTNPSGAIATTNEIVIDGERYYPH
ncbi:MAG TPA: hypothetical protein VHU84_16420 [Lacipirellulaceae bacterium]|nr:hypothetical protein [Lacipirellulaceae bacterium]